MGIENRMLIDFTFKPKPREPENDHIVMIKQDGTIIYEDGWEPEEEITTYCDIYECEACPRYGDDCDGKGEI